MNVRPARTLGHLARSVDAASVERHPVAKMPRSKLENWHCPFCGHYTTLGTDHYSIEYPHAVPSKLGSVALRLDFMACANPACRELSIKAALCPSEYVKQVGYKYEAPIETWTLRPEASMKPFPDCVPPAILNDYREACLTLSRSAKASATLSRRCLQGMIRDFWKVSGRTLFDEINAIQDKVAGDVWDEIQAVRELGNIGAHMAKDVNLIQDVEPREAELLIQLIEDLIQGWYVQRAERQRRREDLIAAANAKKVRPSSTPNAASDTTENADAAEIVPDAPSLHTPSAPVEA